MTAYDPFAAPPEPEPKEVSAPAPTPAGPGEVVVTLKGGAGFEAPWIVIHGPDVASVSAQLNGDLIDLMERTQNAAKKFSGGAASAPSGGGGRPGRKEPPAGAPESPGPGWEYKTGVSKASGKPWSAWMPPKGRDDLKPVFFDI